MSLILTKKKEIVKCLNFIQSTKGNIILIGKKFNIILPFYESPIDSTILEIKST